MNLKLKTFLFAAPAALLVQLLVAVNAGLLVEAGVAISYPPIVLVGVIVSVFVFIAIQRTIYKNTKLKGLK